MYSIPVFRGTQEEDPDSYLRDFVRGCRLSNWPMSDRVEILPDFLEGVALSWYETLQDSIKKDWEQLATALRMRFGTKESPNTLLLQLDQFCQGDGEKVSALAVRYEALWAKYEKAALKVTLGSASGSAGMEHIKMSKFVHALEPRLRLKVMSKDPTTYVEALQIATKKEASLQIEASFLQPKAPVFQTPQVALGVNKEVPSSSGLDQNISKLMSEFADLKLHLVNARAQKEPRREEKPRDKREVTCYGCQEKGHYRNECPKINKREDKHVALMEGLFSEEEESHEVMMAKRGRGKAKEEEEREMEDPKEEKKHKKKKSSRRKIGQSDFPLGQGTSDYELLADLKKREAHITFGQLLALSPKLRKEWGKLASARESKKKKKVETVPMVHKVDIEMKDDIPIVDVIIDDLVISNVYVDGGASINVMSEQAMKDVGLKCSGTSSPYRIQLADNTRVKALGVIKGVEVEVCGITVPTTFQVIPTKPDSKAYPLILGRPWLRKVKAVQKWETGELILQGKNKRVKYNLRSQKKEFVKEDSSTSESSDSDLTEEEETSGGSSESSSGDDEDGMAFGLCLGSDQEEMDKATMHVPEKEKMEQRQRYVSLLGESLSSMEKEQYLDMLDGFPSLFATSYSEVRPITLVEHKIELKPESKAVVQRLRRLGIIQAEALKKEVTQLLEAGFIFPVDDSEWVSPVVVTPKKGGKWRICVDFRPLNACTKRDHFPLPFQDEILDQVAGHEMYSVCDGYSGYFQIRIREEDQRKTSFVTPWGVFAYRVMPFGLTNAPATFQRFMSQVFEPYLGKFIRVFLDDFCIYSHRIDHLEKLRLALAKIDEAKGCLNPNKCHLAQESVTLLGHVVSKDGLQMMPDKVEAIMALTIPKNVTGVRRILGKAKYYQRFIEDFTEIVHPINLLTRKGVPFQWEEKQQEAFQKLKEVLSCGPVLKCPDWSQDFYVNPSVSLNSVGAILLQKGDAGRMQPIYYASRQLTEVETRYGEVEKQGLSLVFSIKKFRSYLLPRPFFFLTSQSILAYLVRKPNPGGKFARWLSDLQEFSFSFVTESTTRSTLADLLTEREEIEKEEKVKKDFDEDLETPCTAYILYFDGAFSPSCQQGAGGIVLVNPKEEEEWAKGKEFPNASSNNVAEYDALIFGLECCLEDHIKELEIRGDSQLIVRQMQGQYKTRSPQLQNLKEKVNGLCKQFEFCKFVHISRHENKRAHEMASQAMESKKEDLVFLIDTGWPELQDVQDYLESGTFSQGLSPQQKQRLRRKASPYTIINNGLYKEGKDKVLRRVVHPKETKRILELCHECSGHFASASTGRRILNTGYYWPGLQKEVVEWCRSCLECQKFGKKQLVPGPLKPIPAYGPFERWGLDFVGPLPRSSQGKYYILVATDYATRWAEAKATIKNNAQTVASFLMEHVCSRFGCPLEILTDGGSSFQNDLIYDLVHKLKIIHNMSTPYYPQCNGLVEKTNGLLCTSLGKLVYTKKRRWDKHLTEVLWAYRTMHKLSIGFTPFQLVYGIEAILPIELEVHTLRTSMERGEELDEGYAQRLMQLDALDEHRLQALQNLEASQQKVKARFDKKRLKKREILEGDLVLRFDSRLDKQLNKKLQCRWEGPFRVKKKFANGTYSLEDVDGCEIPGRTNEYRLKFYHVRLTA